MAHNSQNSRSKSSRHPPHLKGREIGMFYAKRNQKKKQTNEAEKLLAVHMDKAMEMNLLNCIQDIEQMQFPSNNRFDFKSEFLQSAKHQGFVKPLCQIPNLDEAFFNEINRRRTDEEINSKRKKLPAFKMKESILRLIEENQVVVVTGETGCGKTTQVPQYILDSYIKSKKGSLCKIVCTQPRRISAISVAERVAEERGVPWRSNEEVGYQIRLEGKIPRAVGSILFCTTGIMLQKMQSNWDLNDVSHIIVDEVHERDLLSDFLLINLKDILKVRKDLKVVLMSATMNAEEFSFYFDNCPMIEIPGFTYPVTEYTLEDMIEHTGYVPDEKKKPRQPVWVKYKKGARKNGNSAEDESLEEYLKSLRPKYSANTVEVVRNWDEKDIDLKLVLELLRHICLKGQQGAVLVFLPGWMQIKKLNSMLSDDLFFSSRQFLIIPLHSLLPSMQQREVFNKPPKGVRKIILSTNIAETSVTIDDVVYVIDCGQIKMKTLDAATSIQLLQPEWVAMSNVKQRRGRAGRTQPGICYHMFTKYREVRLHAYQLPEMLRSSLEELILNIKVLKLGKVLPFLGKAMNPPNKRTIEESVTMLQRLNALTPKEELTPLGIHLARLPMDPHTGKMILFGAIFSCLDPILSIAASLSFKDAFIVPMNKEHLVNKVKKDLARNTHSDHLMFANAISMWERAKANGEDYGFCSYSFLSSSTLHMLANLKRQYAEYLKDLHFIEHDNPKHSQYNINSGNENLLKAIVCAGLYPNVAMLTGKSPSEERRIFLKAITQDGHKVSVHPKSINVYETELKTGWIAYHLKMKSSEIFLHDTTPVNAFSLLLFGGRLQTRFTGGQEIITIDDWIMLQCPNRQARLIVNLRKELDNLLEFKIQQPGVSTWNVKSKEGLLLRCIIDIISADKPFAVNDSENSDCQSKRSHQS